MSILFRTYPSSSVSFWQGSFRHMKFCMRRFRHQFQVFNSIIAFNSVNVMNHLIRFKVSSKVLFHYQDVFKNVTKFFTSGVFSVFNINISSRMFCYSAVPRLIINTSLFFSHFRQLFHIAIMAPFSYSKMKSFIASKTILYRRGKTALNALLDMFSRESVSAFAKILWFFKDTYFMFPSARTAIFCRSFSIKFFTAICTKLNQHIRCSLYQYLPIYEY